MKDQTNGKLLMQMEPSMQKYRPLKLICLKKHFIAACSQPSESVS